MKSIGLIGEMNWESSIEYYHIINETTKEKLGGLHSAKSLMVIMNFAEIEKLQHEDRWYEAGQILANCAQNLEHGGSDFIVVCTNTMHKLTDQITAGVNIPFLLIADATAKKIIAAGKNSGCFARGIQTHHGVFGCPTRG
jgi:aspartate racemase